MLDLSFSKPSEIIQRLHMRLRTERLALQMTQADVAERAGIGINTVSNLEAGHNVGFESVIRIAIVLNRGKELETLFLPKLDSLEDIYRYDNSAMKRRIRKRKSNFD